MPYIAKSIPDMSIMVTRNIVLDVIRQLLSGTYVEGHDKIKVAYYGPSNVELEAQSFYDPNFDQNQHIRFTDYDKISVTVQEEPVEDSFLKYVDRSESEPSFIEDDDIELWVKPEHVYTRCSINVKYRAATENSVNEWIKSVADRTARYGAFDLDHKVNYSIIVPKDILLLLVDIHRTRESNFPLGETLPEWLKRTALNEYRVISNQSGEENELTFLQTFSRLVGNMEVTMLPEETKNETGSFYESEVKYTFEYNRPVSIIAKYPLVVHNRMLPSIWLNKEVTYDRMVEQGIGTVEYNRYYNIIQHYLTLSSRAESHIYPPYDNWKSKNYSSSYAPMFRCMIAINKDNPNILFNLSNLGKYTLNESYIEQAIKYPERVLDRHRWLFNLEVYSGTEQLDRKLLTIDSLGNVIYDGTIDQRKTHRFIISSLINYDFLDKSTADLFRIESEYFLKHLYVIDPAIVSKGIKLKYLNKRKHLTEETYNELLNKLAIQSYFNKEWGQQIFFLVNNVVVKVGDL